MTAGYIVENYGRDASGHVWPNEVCVVGYDGILYRGGTMVTLFATYSQARCAVKRSIAYAAREGCSWSNHYRIRPVTPHLAPKRRSQRREA
jgi:hypothetical protein